ncbi:MAG: DNA recombination protein RmuC [Puniceicoccales bacterium]|jgi:DNA recombination protein RmuC|nr:DNA recombination protein RmuC [Puniceicoccales bacterium]
MIEHILFVLLLIFLLLSLRRYFDLKADFIKTDAALKFEKEKASLAERAFQEKFDLLHAAEERLRENFSNLSANALKSNNEAFIALAKNAFSGLSKEAESEFNAAAKPIYDSLKLFSEKIQKIEDHRNASYIELREQLKLMNQANLALKTETSGLVNALRRPEVRGRWGEMQLRRTVELAGMVEHVDFEEQKHMVTNDGQNLRPDMVINLPNGRRIVVDSKAPLALYLDAIQQNTEREKANMLQTYASHIRRHIERLGSKNYWDQFSASPEFVILFLPGENFFSDALKEDCDLIEFGVSKRVIPATPTTLIALLQAVAYGWKQDKIAAEAKNIADIGREMYKRIRVFFDHFERVGKSLSASVKSYNEASLSAETRLLSQARKFEQLAPEIKLDSGMFCIDVQPKSTHSSDWE